MANIRKRGSKWQVQVRRKGVPSLSRSFRLKRDAEEWARQIELQADRRELPQDRKVLERTTLRKLVERYRSKAIPIRSMSARPMRSATV